MRFEKGTQECGYCKTKDNLIQFNINTKIKKLPVIKIAFICKDCAKKQNLKGANK